MTQQGFTDGLLLLDNGCFYSGQYLGSGIDCFGEICFNTSTTGYQEVVTDPSYNGQIIVFTFVHIGNVGCNNEDVESVIYLAKNSKPKGIVVRNVPSDFSNHRGMQSLMDFCLQNNITLFAGADTRALTQTIRDKKLTKGNAMIMQLNCPLQQALHDDGLVVKEAFERLKKHPSMEAAELTSDVCNKKSIFFEGGKYSTEITKRDWAQNLAVVDFGIKENILKLLEQNDFDIQVFSNDVKFEAIQCFDAFFLSNGPGDPRETFKIAGPTIAAILASGKPVFGICLGHQLLALALGMQVEKLPQGHRGANHPVLNLQNGKVEITSQNHGFAVVANSLPSSVEVTHVSLFDGVIEGFKTKSGSVMAVQYHPESSPGPHDSRYLFSQFRAKFAN